MYALRIEVGDSAMEFMRLRDTEHVEKVINMVFEIRRTLLYQIGNGELHEPEVEWQENDTNQWIIGKEPCKERKEFTKSMVHAVKEEVFNEFPGKPIRSETD